MLGVPVQIARLESLTTIVSSDFKALGERYDCDMLSLIEVSSSSLACPSFEALVESARGADGSKGGPRKRRPRNAAPARWGGTSRAHRYDGRTMRRDWGKSSARRRQRDIGSPIRRRKGGTKVFPRRSLPLCNRHAPVSHEPRRAGFRLPMAAPSCRDRAAEGKSI